MAQGWPQTHLSCAGVAGQWLPSHLKDYQGEQHMVDYLDFFKRLEGQRDMQD